MVVFSAQIHQVARMTGEKNVNPIPNILTLIRLIGGVVMFCLLASAAGGVPFIQVLPDTMFALQRWGVYVFVIAAFTDLFDGILARQLHAETEWGAILDPIADKILVCGTILGLFTFNTGNPVFALPAALILFREFAVSALREAAAAHGVKIKVSFMGKIKTTVQLVALGTLLVAEAWPAFDLPAGMGRHGLHPGQYPAAAGGSGVGLVGCAILPRRPQNDVKSAVFGRRGEKRSVDRFPRGGVGFAGRYLEYLPALVACGLTQISRVYGMMSPHGQTVMHLTAI
ncbi:MAG: CDP-diacylglycerol--glycerol-3-phosphate 3-phosphatidyltransferase [Asticcacaulis sp.]